MSFISRLDRARHETDDSRHRALSLPTSKREARTSRILHLFSEYIFDLFDANLMDDFKTIDRFECAALDYFGRSFSKEYTIKQHSLHLEFMELLNGLIEKFLEKEFVTIDEFYLAVKATHQDKLTDTTDFQHASEVVDAVAFYSSFECWAEMMNDRAAMRNIINNEAVTASNFSGRMREAVESQFSHISSLSTMHRFDTPSTGK